VNDLLSIASNANSHASRPLDVLIGLTLLGVLPFVIMLMTAFVRIVIVLGLVRQALGTQQLPPSIVLTGLALLLTFLVMSPTLTRISNEAITPYAHGKINQVQVVDRAMTPMRDFMMRQTREKDLVLFLRVARQQRAANGSVSDAVLVPAYVIGELRVAFAIGFALYLPFLAIDLAVASILLALGMSMLSPPLISMPCKLLLFVMVDGWTLICGGLASSFR